MALRRWSRPYHAGTLSAVLSLRLDLPGKCGEHQLRNQEVFYGKRKQADTGIIVAKEARSQGPRALQEGSIADAFQ